MHCLVFKLLMESFWFLLCIHYRQYCSNNVAQIAMNVAVIRVGNAVYSSCGCTAECSCDVSECKAFWDISNLKYMFFV